MSPSTRLVLGCNIEVEDCRRVETDSIGGGKNVMKSMGFYDVCRINGKLRGKIRHWGSRGNGLHGNIFRRHGSDNDRRVIMMDEGGVEVDGKSDEAMSQVYMWNRRWWGWTMIICIVPSDVPSPSFGSSTQSPMVFQRSSTHFPALAFLLIRSYLRSWSRSPTHFMFLIFILFHVPIPDPCFLTPNPNPVPFYFASRPLVLFLFLYFCARTHAHFPRPCYALFDTYTFITSCMFLSLKLT